MTRIAPDWLEAAPTQAAMAALAPARPLFVGGCVRDALMGRAGGDIDIAVITPPEETMGLAEAAGLKAIPTGVDHGVVTIVAEDAAFEIATLRRDVATDGRRAVVAFTDQIAEDAARRDFTMNALYADAAGEVLDPLGRGLADLTARRLRFIGDAHMRLREDYLRILRFFRFHAQFEFAPLDAEGLAACLAEQEGLKAISSERVGAEMRKLLAAPDPGPALEGMGPILTQILPGASWPTGLIASEAELSLAPNALRRLAALSAESVERLRLSNAEIGALRAINDALTLSLKEAAYRHGEEAALNAVAIGGAITDAATVKTSIVRAAAATFPVSAKDLMAAGMNPGPDLGAALKRLEADWIASGFTLSANDLLQRLDS